ncbi:molybdate ABC transporter substrate-binding protein [Streptomyces sp. 15-116A]|uniref:molybdate ABC transporter substrate-binding protein n=1 Tax=Streptomyces sp. 15-116A TaxID=2259035 RepID=UPI0021B3D784|nr:molybdate ABC transporter substrate-binding protein [Streptomyces sp. 15-116A]MCT7353281.1 molybdate ABC transporter substrate-binding protein [Streptomyces sp. 15-116A]
MTRSAHRTHRPLRITGAAAATLLMLSACADADSDADASSGAAGDKISGTVTVFAAASLKESFTELGKRFEKEHPGTKVAFNFSGSDSLAASITSGAPADVFAAASAKTMKVVTDEGAAAGTPATFIRNRLQIATLPGNPEGIKSLKDLTASGLKVVLCDKEVPCGSAAQTALTAAGVEVTPVSYEQDVKSALTKVELKEADAALVYRTDVKAAGDKVEGVEFPESAKAVNDYPIARLEDAPNPAGAKAFLELVQSPEGQTVLTAAGFLKP